MADSPGTLRTLGQLSTVGMSFVLAIVMGFGGGYWLDNWLGTRPWLSFLGFFLGLGAGPAARRALGAALFHALNHAAFKTLLFLGAGAVLHATGTGRMNRLGGLIRRQPVTAACFLVGALALAGLPPLNGFASEWLLLQSLLPGVGVSGPVVASIITITLGMFTLTAGLAAVASVKAFEVAFWFTIAMARSRMPHASAMKPRSGWMRKMAAK